MANDNTNTTDNVFEGPQAGQPNRLSKFDQMRASVSAGLDKKEGDKARSKLEALEIERRQHEQAIRLVDAQIEKLRANVEAGLPIG